MTEAKPGRETGPHKIDRPQAGKEYNMEEVIKLFIPNEGSGNELKNCPFCGSDEVVFIQYKHTAGLRWKVFCCGCSAGVDPGWAQEPHQVATIWNRRII